MGRKLVLVAVSGLAMAGLLSAALVSAVPVRAVAAARPQAGARPAARSTAAPGLPRTAPCKHMIKDAGANLVVPVCGNSKSPPLPTMSNCSAKLHNSASDSNFDVWTCSASAKAISNATKALGLAEKNYDRETSFMGGPPIPDSGTPAEGGDIKIDMYLVSVSAGQEVTRYDPATKDVFTSQLTDTIAAQAIPTDETTDGDGAAASGWMVLNLDRLADPGFESDFVHEFFHLLQYRTNIGYCGGNEWWFTEASATWAESYFVPATAPDEVYYRYVDGFETDPSLSLMSMANDATEDPHGYSSFIWPYFMQQKAGSSSIANVWKSLTSVKSCTEMNEKLDAQLSFADHFRDFAVRNLDDPDQFVRNAAPPVWPENFGGNYKKLHRDFPQAWPNIDPADNLTLDNPGSTQTVSVSLPPLSAEYVQISMPGYVDSPVRSISLDTSALSGASGMSVDLLGYEDTAPGHNKWIRIRESQPASGICTLWDNANGDTSVILVISNSSLSQKLAGPLDIQTHSYCAASASGTLVHTQHHVQYLNDDTLTTSSKVKLTLSFTDTPSGLVGSGSYSYQFSGSDTALNCRFSGSGTGTISDSGDEGFANLFGYAAARPQPPYLIEVVTPPQPAKGCHGGFTLADNIRGCPIVDRSVYYYPPGYLGSYSADLSAVDLDCHDSYSDSIEKITEGMTGTISVQGVVSCGLWTSDCTDGVLNPPSARRAPSAGANENRN